MKAAIKTTAAALVSATVLGSAAAGFAQAQSYRNDSPTYRSEYSSTQSANDQRNYAQLGVVQSIEELKGTNQGNKVAGTILGGVIGGVIGHQFGSGRGNDAATVAGALGGAAVGHGVARDKGTRDAYRVTVRMDNGDTQVLEQGSIGALRIGDRVRVDGGVVSLYAGNSYPSNQGSMAPADAYAPDDRLPDARNRSNDRDGFRTDDRGTRYDRDGNRIDDRPTYRNDRSRPDPLYRMEGEMQYDAQGYRVDADGRRVDERRYRD